MVITGATGILGRAMVRHFAEQGASVVILGRNEKVGNELAEEAKAQGGEAVFLPTNVLDKAALEQNYADVMARYGRIDVLINGAGGNQAGATIPPDKTLFDLDIEAMRQVVDLNREKVHDVILQGIVRTFQNVEVIRELTVLENLLIAGHRQFGSGLFSCALHLPALRAEEEVVRARAMGVLEFMGLTAYSGHYAFGLPYGVLKKIEIARTLMCSPRLIILDEPAAGLNDTETVELAGLIRRIRDEYNCTILLVEHDMGLVMDVCDNICAIAFGKLLAYGTPDVIQKDEGVQQAYLGADDEEVL